MRLIALVESSEHVCCRYRLAAFRPFLEASGHHLRLVSVPRSLWSWPRLIRELSGADVVILQRKLLSPWQLLLLRRAARQLVFDFDDAVFLRDSYSPKGLRSARRLRRFRALVRAADVVAAGNAFLAGHAASVAGPARVSVMPTCVDPERYPLAAHLNQQGRVQLVWIGSSSTLQGLEMIRPILEKAGWFIPGLQLKLICDRSVSLTHLPVVECPWSEATEAAQLAAADIGISWLPDDLWSRGKCGLKVLQYMAAGLPVVANPLGVQAEMVRHGETGYLASTEAEWLAAISALAGNPDRRRAMGLAGRRLVERNFSVSCGAARWLALLQQLERDQEAA